MALGWTMGLNAGSSVPEGGCSFTFITWGEREEHPLRGTWQPEAPLLYLGSFYCLVKEKNIVLVPANVKAAQLTLSPTEHSPPTRSFL